MEIHSIKTLDEAVRQVNIMLHKMKSELLGLKDQMEKAVSCEKAIHERFVKFEEELDRQRLRYNITERKKNESNEKEAMRDKYERENGKENNTEENCEERKEEVAEKKEEATEGEITLEKEDENNQEEEKVEKGQNIEHENNEINKMELVKEEEEEAEKTKTGCFSCFAYCFTKIAKCFKCC